MNPYPKPQRLPTPSGTPEYWRQRYNEFHRAETKHRDAMDEGDDGGPILALEHDNRAMFNLGNGARRKLRSHCS